MCRIARHGTAEILAQQWNAVNADFASLTPLLDFLGGTLSLPKRGRMSIVGNKIGRRTRLFLVDGSQAQPRHCNVLGRGPKTASRHGETHTRR